MSHKLYHYSMNHPENNEVYKEAHQEAKTFHQDSAGLSKFHSVAVVDAVLIKQQNNEIILLIKILEKIENFEKLVLGKASSTNRKIDVNKIDDLISRLGKLDINSKARTSTPKSIVKKIR